jgi:uncharacterized protein YukE
MATPEFDLRQADVVRAEMAALTQHIQCMLSELDSQVRGSLPEWASEAREAYEAGKTKWDAAAAKLPEALGRVDVALAEISDATR